MIPLFKAHPLTPGGRLTQVLASGVLGEGPVTAEFQQALARRFGHNHLVTLNSCTSALTLALRLSGVSAGDEVLTSPFTMVATTSAILGLGAVPVWSDVSPHTFCMLAPDLVLKRTPRTRAVLVTCVAGLVPEGLEEILDLGMPTILDCAQAFSTTYWGRHISHWGDYACFSFQATKHLTTGDGGALAINPGPSPENAFARRDPHLELERATRLRWFGLARDSDPRQRLDLQVTGDIHEFGYKFHMNDIAAAIGMECLAKAEVAVQASTESARFYLSQLDRLPGIDVPLVPAGCCPAWWIFGLRSRVAVDLIDHLRHHGVQASRLWRRNDTYTLLHGSRGCALPGANTVEREALFIPNGWWVSREDQERIVDLISSFAKGKKSA